MILGFRIVEERVIGLCEELKGGLMSYLMAIQQKKVWGFRVLIGKRIVLIWGCKEEGRERNFLYEQCWRTVPQVREEQRREERAKKKIDKRKGGKRIIIQCASILKTLNIYINQLHLFFDYIEHKIYVFVCKNPIGINLESKQIKHKISKISYRILDSTFQ